jgi:hypothetical protein
MEKIVTFALLREGTSDEGLVPHLGELIVRAGAHAVTGSPRGYKGTTAERLSQVMAEETSVDIVFVHRDADTRDSTHRRLEVSHAVQVTDCQIPWIAVVPIQELEAWLILDEAEIRRVAGKPSGRRPLDLPKVNAVESTANPKEILKHALIEAGELTGRRREREKSAFSQRRRTLMDRLDIDGPVCQLSGWRQLTEDINQLAQELNW